MKYCRTCGHRVGENSELAFCDSCGSKLDKQERITAPATGSTGLQKPKLEISPELKDSVNKFGENLKDNFQKVDFQGMGDKFGGLFKGFTSDPKFHEAVAMAKTNGLGSIFNLANIFRTDEEQFTYFIRFLKWFYLLWAGSTCLEIIMSYMDIPYLSATISFLAGIVYIGAALVYCYIFVYAVYKTDAWLLWLKYFGVTILSNVVLFIVCSLVALVTLFIGTFLVPFIVLGVMIWSLFINKERLKIAWHYKRFLLYNIALGVVNITSSVFLFFNGIAIIANAASDSSIGLGTMLAGVVITCLSNYLQYRIYKWAYTNERSKGNTVMSTLMMFTFLPIMFSFCFVGFMAKFIDLKDKEFYNGKLLSNQN